MAESTSSVAVRAPISADEFRNHFAEERERKARTATAIGRARAWLDVKLEQGDLLDAETGMTADDLFALVLAAERAHGMISIDHVEMGDLAEYAKARELDAR